MLPPLHQLLLYCFLLEAKDCDAARCIHVFWGQLLLFFFFSTREKERLRCNQVKNRARVAPFGPAPYTLELMPRFFPSWVIISREIYVRRLASTAATRPARSVRRTLHKTAPSQGIRLASYLVSFYCLQAAVFFCCCFFFCRSSFSNASMGHLRGGGRRSPLPGDSLRVDAEQPSGSTGGWWMRRRVSTESTFHVGLQFFFGIKFIKQEILFLQKRSARATETLVRVPFCHVQLLLLDLYHLALRAMLKRLPLLLLHYSFPSPSKMFHLEFFFLPQMLFSPAPELFMFHSVPWRLTSSRHNNDLRPTIAPFQPRRDQFVCVLFTAPLQPASCFFAPLGPPHYYFSKACRDGTKQLCNF